MRQPDQVVELDEVDPARRVAWDELCVRCGAGYFAGPVWATSWYDSFGDGAPTQVASWSSDGMLDAIAPMVHVAEPLLPGGPGRRVRVRAWHNLGAGPGGADHLGFPAVEHLREDALAWALSRTGSVRLTSLDGSWAVPLARRSVRSPERTRTYAVRVGSDDRPGSKKLWKHIVRSRRQLVDRGVEFDHLIGAAIDRGVLEQLFSLHGIRSERVGRTTTFTTDRLDFHERLAVRSSERNASFLVRATVDGELVGALYGFADPARLHYYQSGWDPSFEKASLGSVLIGDAIALAVERGATTFDFLRGDEPYKLRFGAEAVEDLSVLVPRGSVGRLLSSRDRAAARVDARRARRLNA